MTMADVRRRLNAGEEVTIEPWGRSWKIEDGKYYHENQNYHEWSLLSASFTVTKLPDKRWDEVSREWFYNEIGKEIKKYGR